MVFNVKCASESMEDLSRHTMLCPPPVSDSVDPEALRGFDNLHFQEVPGWFWHCWPGDLTLRTIVLSHTWNCGIKDTCLWDSKSNASVNKGQEDVLKDRCQSLWTQCYWDGGKKSKPSCLCYNSLLNLHFGNWKMKTHFTSEEFSWILEVLWMLRN